MRFICLFWKPRLNVGSSGAVAKMTPPIAVLIDFEQSASRGSAYCSIIKECDLELTDGRSVSLERYVLLGAAGSLLHRESQDDGPPLLHSSHKKAMYKHDHNRF